MCSLKEAEVDKEKAKRMTTKVLQDIDAETNKTRFALQAAKGDPGAAVDAYKQNVDKLITAFDPQYTALIEKYRLLADEALTASIKTGGRHTRKHKKGSKRHVSRRLK